MSRKAIKEIERKMIDPLFCNRIGAALGAWFCWDDDVPFSVFKLLWLSMKKKLLFPEEKQLCKVKRTGFEKKLNSSQLAVVAAAAGSAVASVSVFDGSTVITGISGSSIMIRSV